MRSFANIVLIHPLLQIGCKPFIQIIGLSASKNINKIFHKNKYLQACQPKPWRRLAGGQGFEPRFSPPKGGVLPLDDPPPLRVSLQYSAAAALFLRQLVYFPEKVYFLPAHLYVAPGHRHLRGLYRLLGIMPYQVVGVAP